MGWTRSSFDSRNGRYSTRLSSRLWRRRDAQSPLVGADRIIWASDYPHPDAKFPGVTEELAEALEPLTLDEKRAITSESAIALYGID